MSRKNGNRRLRITAAVARSLDIETLEEAFGRVKLFLQCLKEGIPAGPSTVAQSKKQHRILRAELLKRGFDLEEVDAEIEVPAGLRAEIEVMKAEAAYSE